MRVSLTFRVDDKAMRKLEGFVETFSAERGLAMSDKARTLIVLEELLTNLSKYGYPDQHEPGGIAEAALELAGDLLTIEFADNGQPFDPFAKSAPDLNQSADSRPVGGLGLHMVRELADEASYRRCDGRNLIRLTRRVALQRTTSV